MPINQASIRAYEIWKCKTANRVLLSKPRAMQNRGFLSNLRWYMFYQFFLRPFDRKYCKAAVPLVIYHTFCLIKITRRPATSGIVSVHQFGWKWVLKGWKHFFFKQYFIKFCNFSQFENFAKTPHFRWKTWSKIISFDTHTTASLPLYRFWKKIRFFSKNFLSKKNFRTCLRNLTILVAFYGKFATYWW